MKTKQAKKLCIQISLDTIVNECAVSGSGNMTPLMAMAVCLEGLSVICKKCIDEGMDAKKVYRKVVTYFIKAHDDYEIKIEEN